MAPQTTQAAQSVNTPTVVELDAKIHQLNEKLESTAKNLSQQMAEQAAKQDALMLWVREKLEMLCREKQPEQVVSPPVMASPSSMSQVQSCVTRDGFATPATLVKGRGDGILPLPLLAVSIQPMESTQVSYSMNPQPMQLDSPGRNMGSPGRRLEPPVFEGQNPDDWIFRMEKCFLQNQVRDGQKLDEALPCLLGNAVTWLRGTQARGSFKDWKDFKDKFRKRFRLSRGGSVVWQLLSIRQRGPIEEFRERFEELIVEVPHITDDLLEGIFLKGMRRNLRELVMRTRPYGIDEIVDTTKLIEEQENEKSNFQSTYNSKPLSITNSAPVLNQYNRNGNNSPARAAEFVLARKSFDGSRDNRKTEPQRNNFNPCHTCGERYYPGHRCKNQKINCLELGTCSENGQIPEEDEESESEEDYEPKTESQTLMHLSLSSMAGLTTEKSMRMRGVIGEQEVIVLIDSGATSNFISEEVARRCSLTITPKSEFGVVVGNGQVISGQGKCRNVALVIQGMEIVEDFFLFELGTTDIILDYSWLATLGETRVNWGSHTLRFKVNEEWVTLLGDPALLRQHISLNSLAKQVKLGDVTYLLELSELFTEQDSKSKSMLAPNIQRLLHKYKPVFQLPQGLPPARNREHAITLQQGTAPINVRPYRYSFTQKNEIEKEIREMLDAEIIRPSISPYSSPVLLVKKKRRWLEILCRL